MSLWVLGFAPQIENFLSGHLVVSCFLAVLYLIWCFSIYFSTLNYQVPLKKHTKGNKFIWDNYRHQNKYHRLWTLNLIDED